MKKPPFVGREDELRRLIHLLYQRRKGEGNTVFIEGDTGVGKTWLLEELERKVKKGYAALVKTRFVSGYCYEFTGPQNPYHPFIETLNHLSEPEKPDQETAKLIIQIMKETAPDWLGVIPVLGSALGAGVKTATMAGEWFLGAERERHTDRFGNIQNQYIRTITKIAAQHDLLVLVIEDAHWIDTASCQLLFRLSHEVSCHQLVVILSYRPAFVDDQHPLRQLQQETLGRSRNRAQVIPLNGLTEEDVQNYIQKRFEAHLDPNLATWLWQLCRGNPLFITQYLNLLEQDQIVQKETDQYILDGQIRHVNGNWELSGTLANLRLPTSVEQILQQRIDRLIEEERKMLQLGAVQGEYFMSIVLAELLNENELDLLSRLRRVSERHRIISLYTGVDWAEDKSDVYRFEHILMHQAFYRGLSPRERMLYHQGIGKILERSLKARPNPPRKRLLEVAHHYQMGEERLKAARFYYKAAQSSFAVGASTEAGALCKRVLELIDDLPEAEKERHQLQAESILLLAMCTIDGEGGREEQINLLNLTDEGIAAASRAGDPAILAQIQSIKGHIFVHLGKVSDALAVMQEALEIAQSANDPLTEAVALRNLGSHLVKEDLDQGIKLRYQAYEIYQKHLSQSQTGHQSTPLSWAFNYLLGSLSISEFDIGHYGTAFEQVTTAVTELKRLKMDEDLIWVFNYFGQIYTAMGLFEAAEKGLFEALKLRKTADAPHAWHNNNLALLGKLYLEWQRIGDAVEPLLQGWRQSEDTQQADLLAIVRNYYAELLMHTDYKGCDLGAADQQLARNLKESREAGLHRSTVTALSLRGKLALRHGTIADAVNYSTQAVEYLREKEALPAVRIEEIFFTHYQILKAARLKGKAEGYLQQAYQLLQQKANSIRDEAHRRSFLERVPISRQIVTAHRNTHG